MGCMRLSGRRALIAVGAVVAVIAAVGTALAVSLPSAPAGRPSQRAAMSAFAEGHATVALEIASGTSLLSVRVADLGGASGTPLRVAVPRGVPRPKLRVTRAAGRVRSEDKERISLSASGGAAPVTVTLNSAVTWQLDFAGGTQRTVADLRGGQVAGITVAATSDVVNLTLPRPAGMVPVHFAGGAGQLLVSLPGGAPVRVTAAKGAGQVSLDGKKHTGVSPGAVFATRGWAAKAPGFDVETMAGVARIAVTRW
jgi:hypothetical protein